ncbi:MAG: polysaccharide biosynthesis/export family protein [Pseudomonadota bacterium]
MKFILLVALCVLTSACLSPRTAKEVEVTPETVRSLHQYRKVYRIQPGDTIEVYVYQHSDFSKRGVVRPDGVLSLPLLDDILVEGLTPMELDSLITQRLSERIREPEVTVFIENVQEPMIYVLGEVGQVTAVPLRNAPTIAAALAEVGGPTKTGTIRHLAIIRIEPDGYLRAIPLDPESRGQPGHYMAMYTTRLRAEDIVFIPESSRSQFVRAIQDFVTAPLTGFNQILSPYLQFELIEEIR